MKNKKLFAILTLVCFMFTLMPVAAFADYEPSLADAQDSYVYAEDVDVDVNDEVEVTIDAAVGAAGATAYVWFEQNENVPSTNVAAVKNITVNPDNGVGEVTLDADGDNVVKVKFTKAGTYEVHAALKNPAAPKKATWAENIAAIADYEMKTQAGYDVVTVSADAAKTKDYVIVMDGAADEDYVVDDKTVTITGVTGNGIEEETVKFTVYKGVNFNADKSFNSLKAVVYASDIEIDTTTKVSVNDLKVRRDGTVTFDVVAEKAGTHKVYVTIGDYKVTFKIDANEGKAESIEVDYVSAGAVNIDSANNGLAGSLRFAIYDANGNELVPATGETTLTGRDFNEAQGLNGTNNNYVAIVEQPAKSKIKNKDLKLEWQTSGDNKGWTIDGATFKEEGDYTFKVALDDGTSAKATITVKEAGDPVALTIAYNTDSVQLGAKVAPKSIGWLDANKVFTNASGKVEFTASGAAVKDVTGTTITVKDDEKYIGSTIEVAVVDEENNLIATKTLTVAAEAKELVFDTKEVPVDTTRTIGVKLVDADGKTVALDNVTTASAYVVVMEKPAGSDVTADVKGGNDNVTAKKGTFDINFSADTVGLVKIQAVLKADANGVVRYYTGTTTISVGGASNDAVVVMSVNSNQMVVGDKVVEIPAPAVVKDARTFVPFRALTEAFGAEVAWDEATQSVTAVLDGVTVVLTIGSPAYTVNGVEYTADVAPYIAGAGYTMVPVRFAAEAFGYTVEYTTDANGAVADILFL